LIQNFNNIDQIAAQSLSTPFLLLQIGVKMVMPHSVLEKSLNKRISILLKDGRLMEGNLKGFDDYMNMVLEGTEEDVEGAHRKIGTVILRGNNIVSITPI